MIIVKLYGGLGNQLFQVAHGLSLKKPGEKMFIDDSWFQSVHEGSTPRENHLHELGMHISVIGSAKVFFYFLCKLFAGKKIFGISFFFLRDGDTVSPKNNGARVVFCDGYWHDEKLIREGGAAVGHILRKRLERFCIPEFLGEITNPGSVALHVRRGDYLSERNMSIYVSLSKEYYQKAISMLSTKANIKFFVFSDDPVWVKENISFLGEKVYWVSDAALNDVEEFLLMCCCEHHVMANSTFSWWAAYVNKQRGVKLMPMNWYHNNNSKIEKIIFPEAFICE